MNALEARKLSQSTVKGRACHVLVANIKDRIKKRARQGDFSLTDPFGSDLSGLTEPKKQAVIAALRAEGYQVIEHEDPDPGHPCSRPYIEVKW